MWDVPVLIDRIIVANQPDKEYCMIKKDNTCQLADIAIPNDANVNTKETEELSKYKGL